MATVPQTSCRYHVEGVDYRLNAEECACCASFPDVARWLLSQGYEWNGRGFLRKTWGKTLYAAIRRDERLLSEDELERFILPHFQKEAA